MVSKWAQELLSYHFSVLYRPTHMMANVDALTRLFDNITAQYLKIATLLSHYDRTRRPAAYIGDLKSVSIATIIPATDHTSTLDILILTDTIINGKIDKVTASQSYHSLSAMENSLLSLSSVPIMLHSSTGRCKLTPIVEPPTNISGKMKN